METTKGAFGIAANEKRRQKQHDARNYLKMGKLFATIEKQTSR